MAKNLDTTVTLKISTEQKNLFVAAGKKIDRGISWLMRSSTEKEAKKILKKD